MGKFVVLSLLVTLGISGGAEAASTKFKTLEELKNYLQKQALDGNYGQKTCTLREPQPNVKKVPKKGKGWYNKSSNIITSSELDIESSDMEAVSTKYSDGHIKVSKTTQHMKNIPKCVNVTEETAGQTVHITKQNQNVASSSATSQISNDIKFGAGVSASTGVYSAQIDLSYGTTSTKSTSVASSVSDSDQTEYILPLGYVKSHGPYSMSFHTQRYITKGSPTLDVTYKVKGLKVFAQCEYVSSKSHKNLSNYQTVDIALLADETEYTIPTKIDIDVDYVDQWPSYEQKFGTQCDGTPFKTFKKGTTGSDNGGVNKAVIK